MSKPIITKQMLIDADACSDQVDLFEKTFGDSVVVTVSRAKKVAHLFDLGWAAQLLDAQGRDEYQRVEPAAQAQYRRAWSAALDEHKCVEATALAEYDRTKASAWATAFIDMPKRGKRA